MRSMFDACFRHGVVARLEWPAGVYDDGWGQSLQLYRKSLPYVEDGNFSQTHRQCLRQDFSLICIASRNALSKIAVAAEDQNFAHWK